MTTTLVILVLALVVAILFILSQRQEVSALKSVCAALQERNDQIEEHAARAATARDQAVQRLENVITGLKVEITGLEAAIAASDDPAVRIARLRELANWNTKGPGT